MGTEDVLSQTVQRDDEEPLFVAPTDLRKLPPHIWPDSEEVYPMKAKPRGIALIINIEFFYPSDEKTQKEQERERLDSRHGSEKDLKALARLFEALDFQVKTNRNLKKSELMKVLDDVSCDDHSAYDCFVLCLMSHGKEGAFYCADGETILLKTITDFFRNSMCTTLKGKPKLFFIQACRGNVKETGVVKVSPNSPVPQQPSDGDDDEEEGRGNNFSFARVIIPDHADIQMVYSTVSGFASSQNPHDGSRFIRCLVEVFKEKASHEDSPDSALLQQPSNGDDDEEEDRGYNFWFPQEIIPDHADILMAYSTVSGFASFRNPRDGSRFVRCLVEVFKEKASHEDVLSMLTMVNAEISKMGEIDTKQVGQPTSTLTKKVYFWPGL